MNTGVDARERQRHVILSHPHSAFKNLSCRNVIGTIIVPKSIITRSQKNLSLSVLGAQKKTCRSLPSDFRRSPASTPVHMTGY